MNLVKIEMTLKGVRTLEQLHSHLKEVFKLPDFYGENTHALIDCLSSLRYPEDGMIGITLKPDEYLVIRVKNFLDIKENIKNQFVIAIEEVNRREKMESRDAMIYVSFE